MEVVSYTWWITVEACISHNEIGPGYSFSGLYFLIVLCCDFKHSLHFWEQEGEDLNLEFGQNITAHPQSEQLNTHTGQ